jgi:electron transfer flavoprotein beta subunit
MYQAAEQHLQPDPRENREGKTVNIVVCVKQVVDTEAEKRLDPESWRLDRSVDAVLNPYDEYAVEEALLLKEAGEGEVTVLCMGPEEADDAIRKALAMGADSAVLVSDPALAGSDLQGTAYALAEALKTMQYDVVFFGSRSTDGETGCVPAAVAELLGLPLLSATAKLEVSGTTAKANRETEAGYITYECPLPAVVSVIKGINEPRYPTMKGILGAKRKTVDTKDAGTLGLDSTRIGLAGSKTKVTTARVAEARKAGVKVEDDGTGARQLADFLSGEKLV